MGKNNIVVGYARVSTEDQNLDAQIDELTRAGCEKIYSEKASGAKMNRKQLRLALQDLREGDTLVITKVDRLARTMKGLMDVVETLSEWNVNLKITSMGIDANTVAGKMMLQLMGVFAEFERNMIAERTKEGMAARKARGIKFGPKHSIADNPKRLAAFQKIYDNGEIANLTDREKMTLISNADKKAKPITSLTTYNNWKKAGYPGIQMSIDEPLGLKPRGRPRKEPLEKE